MEMMLIYDVIIPVYHPGKEFSVLLERLTEQTAVIHRIIAMNTEENYWNKELEQKYPLLEVHHLKKSEFAERKRYEENSSALIDTVIGAEYSCAGTRRGKNGTEEVYNACQRA